MAVRETRGRTGTNTQASAPAAAITARQSGCGAITVVPADQAGGGGVGGGGGGGGGIGGGLALLLLVVAGAAAVATGAV